MRWGINWLNVQVMLADAAKVKDLKKDGEDPDSSGEINRTINSKEEFEQYINSLM